jgi:hypothetical protein
MPLPIAAKPAFRAVRKTLLQKAAKNRVFGAVGGGKIGIRETIVAVAKRYCSFDKQSRLV